MLDPDRFRKLARRDGLSLVLNGLAEAKRVGFGIKVNAVALREVIDRDAVPLARYCREHGFELRFIESMPIGADPWDRAEFVPAHEILDLLDAEVGPLVPATDRDPHAPATTFQVHRRRRAGGRDRVGEQTLLRQVRPPAADRRRQAPQLPVSRWTRWT